MHTFNPGAPPQPLPSFQSSMHTFTPCAFPQPWTSSSRPYATYQTSMHFSSSPSACTSHPAQVHHTRPAYTSHPAQVHYTNTVSIALPHLFHHPSLACTALPHFFHHPIQYALLQSKCIPDPHRIIQSNCTTQVRQQSNYKTEKEKDGHIRDPECFQECI